MKPTAFLTTAAEWWDFAPWQDMDSAPRDGTPILGLNDDTGMPMPVYFDSGDYWCAYGYYLVNDGEQKLGFDLPISKWLPLPQVSK